MGISKSTPVGSIGTPAGPRLAIGRQDQRRLRAPAWPVRTGSAPQTSARPPVLANGTASLVAIRIFTRILRKARLTNLVVMPERRTFTSCATADTSIVHPPAKSGHRGTYFARIKRWNLQSCGKLSAVGRGARGCVIASCFRPHNPVTARRQECAGRQTSVSACAGLCLRAASSGSRSLALCRKSPRSDRSRPRGFPSSWRTRSGHSPRRQRPSPSRSPRSAARAAPGTIGSNCRPACRHSSRPRCALILIKA